MSCHPLGPECACRRANSSPNLPGRRAWPKTLCSRQYNLGRGRCGAGQGSLQSACRNLVVLVLEDTPARQSLGHFLRKPCPPAAAAADVAAVAEAEVVARKLRMGKRCSCRAIRHCPDQVVGPKMKFHPAPLRFNSLPPLQQPSSPTMRGKNGG